MTLHLDLRVRFTGTSVTCLFLVVLLSRFGQCVGEKKKALVFQTRWCTENIPQLTPTQLDENISRWGSPSVKPFV